VKRVLKWEVKVDDMPHEVGSGMVVHVECQHGPSIVHVWTEETEESLDRMRTVQIFGTGQPIPITALWLGTTVAKSAITTLVWHAYELEDLR
jgi:hypothetical protein